MKILENIRLKDFTTFHIGGPARFFARVESSEDLKTALAFAHERQVPFFILGGGSNILVSDEGFPGLVLKMEISGVSIDREHDGYVYLTVGAGVDWDGFVEYSVKHGLYGLENLSLIPGSVGAAPVQNIGAYGVEVKESIDWVEASNSKTGDSKIFSREECTFGYRDSFFKTPEGGNYIITRVGFKLPRHSSLTTSYEDVVQYFKTKNIINPTLIDMREAIINIRIKKLPNVKQYGTAGSFFKNPIITEEKYQQLQKLFPELPNFPAESGKRKISAAWLLDRVCGFKGYREGNVGVYQNQALVLVNFGDGTAQDIKKLSEKMIACVNEKTKIILEREVQFI